MFHSRRQANESSLTSTSPALCKNKACQFLLTLALSRLNTPFFDFYKISCNQGGKVSQRLSIFIIFFQILNIEMDAKLSKIWCIQPSMMLESSRRRGKISEDAAKKWLIKQALWQINLTAPKHIPRPKFDVSTPNAVHQADLLLSHDTQGRGQLWSGPKNIQIRFDNGRCCQAFQRDWTLYL